MLMGLELTVNASLVPELVKENRLQHLSKKLTVWKIKYAYIECKAREFPWVNSGFLMGKILFK